jgi:hypothetical protein
MLPFSLYVVKEVLGKSKVLLDPPDKEVEILQRKGKKILEPLIE